MHRCEDREDRIKSEHSPVWRATIREEDHDLVDRLRVLGEVVPEHVGVLQVGLGITLLGVDKVGELSGVTDKEHGGVVEDLHGERHRRGRRGRDGEDIPSRGCPPLCGF